MYDLNEVIAAFNHKGFHAQLVPDRAAALQAVAELIADANTVGVGGSVTLQEIGLPEYLAATDKTVYGSGYGADSPDAPRKAMDADVYLLSANALVKTGEFINIDGRCNRLGAFIYGPGKCVVVAGKNKLTDNPHAAIARIKSVACVKNAQRLNKTTPCAGGKCTNCDEDGRMCRVTVRMEYPPRGHEIYLVLVNEDLGY